MLKQRATSDNEWSVRRVAIQELVRGWKEDPETLPMLKQRATSDNDGDVRQAAIQELARGWKDDPDLQSFLRGSLLRGDRVYGEGVS